MLVEIFSRCFNDSIFYFKACLPEICFVIVIIFILFILQCILDKKKLDKNLIKVVAYEYFIYTLDGVYLTYLYYLTLGMRYVGFVREIKMIPFLEIFTDPLEIPAMVENFLLFVPYGILMSMTFYDCTKKKVVCRAAVVSLMIEIMQFVFSCGNTEINDWLLNVIGTVCGCVIMDGIRKIRSRMKRTDI